MGRADGGAPESAKRSRWEAATAIAALIVAVVSVVSIGYTGYQVKITRQQQDADRFGRAVEQLAQEGVSKLSIRLGGIYSLETLMNDTEDYRAASVEVISGFVRGHAATLADKPTDAKLVKPSSPDVLAAITVLGRRDHPDQTITNFDNAMLGLNAAVLHRADLHQASLVFVNLGGADLSEANLNGAQLDDSHLGDADLKDAHLRGADLGGAYFGQAHLEGADLTDAEPSTSQPSGGKEPTQFECVWVDSKTRLPAGVPTPHQPPTDNPRCQSTP